MTIYDTRHNSRPTVVTADDGRELPATWYLPGEQPRGAVLLAPAMATPARFYADFAWWLAGHGFATLTFDYRGMGSRAAMKAEPGDLLRWMGDAASALEHLVEEAPGVPVTWVGHSLGGQALPFVRHDLVDRALLIAAGSGYWRYNQRAIRSRAPLFFRVIVPLAIRASGYYPGRRLGLLGDVPPHVMRQWARWCLHPGYFADVSDLEDRVAELELPITALSFTDDELLSAESHTALEELYAATAPVEAHRLAPADLGLERIGHHGFFRPDKEPAWEQVVLPHLAR